MKVINPLTFFTSTGTRIPRFWSDVCPRSICRSNVRICTAQFITPIHDPSNPGAAYQPASKQHSVECVLETSVLMGLNLQCDKRKAIVPFNMEMLHLKELSLPSFPCTEVVGRLGFFIRTLHGALSMSVCVCHKPLYNHWTLCQTFIKISFPDGQNTFPYLCSEYWLKCNQWVSRRFSYCSYFRTCCHDNKQYIYIKDICASIKWISCIEKVRRKPW